MTCPLALHPSINITLSGSFAWLLPPRLILLALLLRVISDYLPHLIEPFDNSFQAFKISLPAVIRTFVIGLLTRPEAGLLHPQHVPSVVGDNVQVTTVFNPVAAFSTSSSYTKAGCWVRPQGLGSQRHRSNTALAWRGS